ncbi:MAG: hypothetical protein ACYCZY_04350 [Lacisediminihabitans sp.]
MRQKERGTVSDATASLAQLPPRQPSYDALPREGWEVSARRSAAVPVPEQPSSRSDAAIVGGRRSQQQFPQSVPQPGEQAPRLQVVPREAYPQAPRSERRNGVPLSAEPLSYITQVRPQVPSYDGPSFRVGALAAVPPQVGVPPMEALDVQPSYGHRLSPEEPPEYRIRDFSPESRRAASAPTAETPASTWALMPTPGAPGGDLDYFTEQGVRVQPGPEGAVPATQSVPALPVEYTLTRRQLRALQATGAPAALVEPLLRAEPAPQAEPASESADPASAENYTLPVGHWSTQAAIDDEIQVYENTLSRDVGVTSGAITTSTLVVSSIPTVKDLMGPLSSTGEILVTGTIDLPRSLGSTGVHPARYDHSDVDALLEADDREDSAVDSAPVRASRAVSTHTSARDVIAANKPPRNGRLPMVLAVTAAVMAVGVVVLIVGGMIFKIF